MMTESAEARLAQRMAALRKTFVHQMPERLVQIEDALAGKIVVVGEEPIASAERLAHSIRGTAATFSFKKLSEAAFELEVAIREARGAGRGVDGMVKDARAALYAAASDLDASDRIPTLMMERVPAMVARVEEVWLVLGSMPELSEQLSAFVGEWRVIGAPGEAVTRLERARPVALVLDLEADGADALLARAREQDVPVIGVTRRNDFESRLAAVRAGVRSYFCHPIDVSRVVEQVERIGDVVGEAPARVLLVDDDLSAAKAHAAMLEAQGMKVRIVTEPAEVFVALEDHSPDIVLVDLYMPHCNGLELASVLRQEEAWVGLPIMFLSSEHDVDKHLAAMGRGADDFLTKPVSSHRLVTQVRARVTRARAMRALMHHDSLTGLLNHIAFKERVASEIARCRREGQPLAIALIDLDHFKSVNDLYGHPIGDRVLRTLARLLRQRLRKSDGVGRYGGEEFGLVLPNAGVDDALRIVDEIRRAFGAIVQHAGDRTFSATLSAGVAVLAGTDDARLPDRLIADADAALYRAKRGGRDCVKVAERRKPR